MNKPRDPVPPPTACCGNCTAFRWPPEAPDAATAELLTKRGLGQRPGTCRLYPETVPKAPDDWCRQHERRASDLTSGVTA